MHRFNITYKIFAENETIAKNIAISICHENTVEIPSDIVPNGFIKEEIVGKIEKIEKNDYFKILISYSNQSIGFEINQLLTLFMETLRCIKM